MRALLSPANPLPAAIIAPRRSTVSVHKYVSVKTRVVEKPTALVVVAADEITPGTALGPAMVKTASWPLELVPQGAPPA